MGNCIRPKYTFTDSFGVEEAIELQRSKQIEELEAELERVNELIYTYELKLLCQHIIINKIDY